MTSFTNLVETLEKLAFEILLWIIFIPKTLFKIIWNPSWVPGYVDEELAKEKGRFSEYVSPLILLTIIVVGMAGAIQWINSSSDVELVYPQTAMVGEETIFYAKPKFLWSDAFIFSTWIITNDTGEVDDVFLRYNLNLFDTDDVNVSNFLKFTEGRVSPENQDRASREEYFEPFPDNSFFGTNYKENYVSPVSKLTYSWENAGAYTIVVAFFGDYGEAILSDTYKIYISSPDESFQPSPFTENKIDSLKPFLGAYNNLISESVFENRELSASLVLIALFFPLIIGLASHILQGGNLSRFGLQRHLYIHAMYFSPLIFSGLVCVFLFISCKGLIDGWYSSWWHSDNFYSIVWFLAGSWCSFLLALGWFIFAEVRFFIRELKTPALTFLACLVAIWLIRIFTNYQIPFRNILYTDLIYPDLVYFLFILPLSFLVGATSDVRALSTLLNPLGNLFSSSDPVIVMATFYFAIIGLPPLAYISYKYLPGLWGNLLNSIIERRRKADYLQRVKHLIPIGIKISKTGGLVVLVFLTISLIINLVFYSIHVDFTRVDILEFFTGSLFFYVCYFITLYLGILLVCFIFALLEKISGGLVIFWAGIVGFAVPWILFNLLTGWDPSSANEFYFPYLGFISPMNMTGKFWVDIFISAWVIPTIAYVVFIANAGWKINRTLIQELTLPAKE